MSRPKNKNELVEQARKKYHDLTTLISDMPLEVQLGTFPFEDRDKNIRDVLIHLHEWHNMMESWYNVGMSGGKPAMPREGYNWRQTPALNQKIWEEYQHTSLPDAKQLLASSHEKMLKLIELHTDEELFTKKYYSWTGGTSLGACLISATSSHYDWGIKKIKKYKREITQK